MEEEPLSMISHGKLNTNEESSDSNCSVDMYHYPCKRSRVEEPKEIEPQPNETPTGQIQAYQHWKWSELRLNASKFANFLTNGEKCELPSTHEIGDFSCTLLFPKELTKSDVGKLNRLVIPKRYATKYFPRIPDRSEDEDRVVQLEFYDRDMKLWKFRYCYWNSSESFVLTRGWNKFVREKKLSAKDTITFYKCKSRDRQCFGPVFFMIDVANKFSRSDINDTELKLGLTPRFETIKEERFELENYDDLKGNIGSDGFKEAKIIEVEVQNVGTIGSSPRSGKKGFKLFGVQIVE